jgi:hypothetical protein
MKFEDLTFESDDYHTGINAHHIFDNHYGVSIIKSPYSYGGKQGLYELAILVMKPEDKYSELCYDTHITNDVMGHLTPENITDIMKEVSELPTRE